MHLLRPLFWTPEEWSAVYFTLASFPHSQASELYVAYHHRLCANMGHPVILATPCVPLGNTLGMAVQFFTPPSLPLKYHQESICTRTQWVAGRGNYIFTTQALELGCIANYMYNITMAWTGVATICSTCTNMYIPIVLASTPGFTLKEGTFLGSEGLGRGCLYTYVKS